MTNSNSRRHSQGALAVLFLMALNHQSLKFASMASSSRAQASKAGYAAFDAKSSLVVGQPASYDVKPTVSSRARNESRCGLNLLPPHNISAISPGVEPIIYFVVTTSLQLSSQMLSQQLTNGKERVNESQIQDMRRTQYTRGIRRLLNETSKLTKNHSVFIVENNGPRKTFLDDFGIPVLYTNNNMEPVARNHNKGITELLDVMACISHFGMRDTDFLVKMTGRYYLDDDSCFMQILEALDLRQTHAVVKFGSFSSSSANRMNDCITGLIMLPVYAVRKLFQHVNQRGRSPIEWEWARAALSIEPPDRVWAIPGTLGINIAPGGRDNYFLV